MSLALMRDSAFQQEQEKPLRPVQFRENRLVIPSEANGRGVLTDLFGEVLEFQVLNVSHFGARIKCDKNNSLLSVGMHIRELKFLVKECEIFRGSALVVNENSSHSSSIEFGLVLNEPGVNLDRVNSIINYSIPTEITKPKDFVGTFERIDSRFKILVSDMITFLNKLKNILDTEEKFLVGEQAGVYAQKAKEEQIINQLMSLYSDNIIYYFEELRKVTCQFSPEENALHKQYFRTNFKPIAIDGCPFMNRALSKPLGYAGDYGLMVMFYDYDDSGDSLFHKFWHRFSCNTPASVANKNRIDLLKTILLEIYETKKTKQSDFRVSSIACGPAKEIEFFLKAVENKSSAEIKVTCIDQDANAVSHAKDKLRSAVELNPKIKTNFFQEDAVLGIIKEREFTQFIVNNDVIISAGLFDYLSDRVSQKLIEKLYSFLKPGGVLIIGNVAKGNPDEFAMDYVMDWSLILRSPEQLKNLVSEEIRQSSPKIEVIAEPLNLNLFLIVTKPN